MHGVLLAPDFSSFVDVWDNREHPPSITVRSMTGAPQHVLHESTRVNLDLQAPELHQFRTRDGVELHAAVYRPLSPPLRAGSGTLSPPPRAGSGTLSPPPRAGEGEGGGRAPVIVEVYGGPGPQMVNDSWVQTVDLRAQWLSQHGFVVLKVDNRGSARRGLAFEAPINRRMGQIEVQDQVDGVRWLGTLGFADTERVGITGWSYGGFMTLMALIRAS